MARKSYLTTFDVSQICEVNPTTVQNWVKENKLKAFSTPGGHRRIRREDLISFMKEFSMPIPGELKNPASTILIVDDEKDVIELLTSLFETAEEELEVTGAQSGVEALLLIGARRPDLLILDHDAGNERARGLSEVEIGAFHAKPEDHCRVRRS